MAEDVTDLLRSLGNGDKEAESKLISLVHGELRAIASRLMRAEAPGHTLQATALVNEAYLRLVSHREIAWKDRAHFFGVAAQVMRHILVDYARRRGAAKRGAGAPELPLDECLVIAQDRLEDLLVIEDALHKLEDHDPRAIQVFVLRFYGGLSVEETAVVLRTSARTVKRDWNYGRAWLRAELASKSHGTQSDQEPD